MIEVENNLQTQIHRKKITENKNWIYAKRMKRKNCFFFCWNKWQKYSIPCLYSKLFKCFDFNFYFISFFRVQKLFFFHHNLFELVQYATQHAMKIKTKKKATNRWKMENNVNQNKNIRIYNILLYSVFTSYHQALVLLCSLTLELDRFVSVSSWRDSLTLSVFVKNCDCKHQWFWIVVWMRERYLHTHKWEKKNFSAKTEPQNQTRIEGGGGDGMAW